MKWTKKQITNFFFIIGVVAVVVMILTFDVSFVELWQHICRAGLWLIPIIGVWTIIYAMNAEAWLRITYSTKRERHSIGFWRIFKLTISGYALNYATPVAGLGGEPYRMMELSKDVGNERASSSVILYVMTHILAHFMFWFSAILVYVFLSATGNLSVSLTTHIIAGVCAVIGVLVFYLFSRGYRNGVVVNLFKGMSKFPIIGKWSSRFLERHEASLCNIDSQIAMLNQQDKKTFWVSLLLEYASRFVQSFEIMFMLLLFGIDGDGVTGYLTIYLQSIFILALTTIMSNLLGFLPMQLGGQEGGFVLAIAMLGLPPALGILVCIISRVREIFWIVVGLVLMKIAPHDEPSDTAVKKIEETMTEASERIDAALSAPGEHLKTATEQLREKFPNK